MQVTTHVASSPQIHQHINNIPSHSDGREGIKTCNDSKRRILQVETGSAMRTMQMALSAFVVRLQHF